MPKFGAYETVAELHRGPLGGVWTARRGGAAAPTFVVKTCTPDIDITGSEQAGALVEMLREAAEVQKAAAGAGGEGSHWAPVHEVGAIDADADAGTAGGAYWVSDYYPRSSLQRWVEARQPVDAKGLAAVLRGVMAGLRELQTACGRAHGYLKASNVLVAGDGDLSQVRVLLTDALPTARLARKGADRADLRGLGELIHHLVLGQAYREMGAWPLQDSSEWKQLKGGGKWRELCNRLLAPEGSAPLPPSPGIGSLEDVEREIAGALEAGKRARWVVPAIAGGAVATIGLVVGLIVVLGGGAGKRQVSDDRLATAQEKFQALSAEFFNWGRGFVDALAKAAPTEDGTTMARRLWYEQDAGLKALLDGLLHRADAKAPPPGVNREMGYDINPQMIVEDQGDPEGWATGQSRPKAATTENGAAATETALQRVDHFKDGLSKWATGAGFGDAAKSLREPPLSLEAEAALVEGLAAKLTIEVGQKRKEGLASDLDAALLAGTVAKRIAGAWGEILAAGEKLRKTEDVVLGAYASWATTEASRPMEVGSEAAPALRARLKAVEGARDIGTRLVGFVDANWENANRDLLAGEEGVYKRLGGGEGADRATFEEWLGAAPGYVRLTATDPRGGVATLVEEVAELRRLLQAVGEATTDRPEVDGALADWKELQSHPWIQKRREQVDRGVAVLRARLEGLKTTLTSANKDLQERGERWAREIRSKDDLGGAKAINEAWIRGRDKLLKDHETALILAEKGVKAWQAALEKFDHEVKEPEPVAGDRDSWRGVLRTLEDSERERLLSDALKEIEPSTPEATVSEVRASASAGYSAWLASAERLAEKSQKLEGMLNAAYGLKETSADGTVEEMAGECAKAASDLGESMPGAIRPVMERVKALREISDLRDPAALVVAATGVKEPERLWAAWRGLTEPALAWPSSVPDLRDGVTIRERVVKMLEGIRGTAGLEVRRKELESELGRRQSATWERVFAGLKEPAQISEAVGMLGGFGVSEEAVGAMPERLWYNIELARLREAVAAGKAPDDAAVEKSLESFRGAVSKMGIGLNERVVKVLSGLDEVKSGKDKPKPQELGPGSKEVGWTGNMRNDGGVEVLEFTPPQSLRTTAKLAFIGVDKGEGGRDSFFLSTTEVSLRQFSGIVGRDPKRWGQLWQLRIGLEDTKEASGVWKTDGEKFLKADKWCAFLPNATQTYPDELCDEGSEGMTLRKEGLPDWDHPMQRVSIAAALYVARLAGCRLPRSDEWNAAVRYNDARSGDRLVNLRDKTWGAQLRHTITRRRDAVAADYPWPNEDIFVPKANRGIRADPTTEEAATAENDGYLWFARVGVDAKGTGNALPGFCHLRGNVSEYVADVPSYVIDAASGTELGAEADGIKGFLQRNFNSLGVIGGSALSPPPPPPPGGWAGAEPPPFDTLDPLEGELMGKGYADVGFRLAFSARGSVRTLAERVWDKVSEADYLLE